ncbi:uncharacterized protein LOC144296919 [Canis aureus]
MRPCFQGDARHVNDVRLHGNREVATSGERGGGAAVGRGRCGGLPGGSAAGRPAAGTSVRVTRRRPASAPAALGAPPPPGLPSVRGWRQRRASPLCPRPRARSEGPGGAREPAPPGLGVQSAGRAPRRPRLWLRPLQRPPPPQAARKRRKRATPSQLSQPGRPGARGGFQPAEARA